MTGYCDYNITFSGEGIRFTMTDAMQLIEDQTCIRFRNLSSVLESYSGNETVNYILLTSARNMWVLYYQVNFIFNEQFLKVQWT